MTHATGIGSWPGTDVREATRVIRDLLGDHLPHIPELPARGPGADMVGRGTAMLVDLHAELAPSGWRLADHPGRDRSRAGGFLRNDVDELAEAFDGWEGDLKVQVIGPWTLAAYLEVPRGERVLTDPGAVKDLRESLIEGVRDHVADVERLVPGARVVLQVDEPALPAVLDGRLPTASGYGRVRAVDPQVVSAGLRDVVGAIGERAVVIHCCDRAVPLPLLRETGARAIALDTTDLSPLQWESVATTLEEGIEVWAGCLPTDGSGDQRSARDGLAEGWRRTGLEAARLDALTVSPACGVAGLSPTSARDLYGTVVDLAAALTETALTS